MMPVHLKQVEPVTYHVQSFKKCPVNIRCIYQLCTYLDFLLPSTIIWAFPVAQLVKNPPSMQEPWV